jgi:SAM-dependent methyltransferase
MTMSDAFNRVFGGLERQGPGSAQSTLKALSLLPDPIGTGTILDLGCGTGASTVVLASTLNRLIIASDLNAASLEIVRARVRALGLEAMVETRQASMDDLGLPAESVALVWCEGAAFTVGLEKALSHWWTLLAPGAFVAFSDLAWVTPRRPPEAVALLDACYEGMPPMTDVAGMVAIANRCGYRQEAHFVLPEADWWAEYYAGLSARNASLRPVEDPALAEVVAHCVREMSVVRRFGEAFGYVFQILSKPKA